MRIPPRDRNQLIMMLSGGHLWQTGAAVSGRWHYPPSTPSSTENFNVLSPICMKQKPWRCKERFNTGTGKIKFDKAAHRHLMVSKSSDKAASEVRPGHPGNSPNQGFTPSDLIINFLPMPRQTRCCLTQTT